MVAKMNARPALQGKWCDTEWRITPHVAATLAQAGYLGVARYVPLPGNSSVGDVSGVEVGCILDAGLQLLLVQHCRKPPVLLKLYDGTIDAGAAAAHAALVGYPAGAHLFLDLEGAAGTSDEVWTYCVAWGESVRSSGFLAGLYVGYSAILSPEQLYDLPPFNSYWSDMGPRVVASRGFAVKQQNAVTVAGVGFDGDTVTADAKGEVPIVCGV